MNTSYGCRQAHDKIHAPYLLFWDGPPAAINSDYSYFDIASLFSAAPIYVARNVLLFMNYYNEPSYMVYDPKMLQKS